MATVERGAYSVRVPIVVLIPTRVPHHDAVPVAVPLALLDQTTDAATNEPAASIGRRGYAGEPLDSRVEALEDALPSCAIVLRRVVAIVVVVIVIVLIVFMTV